MLLRTAREEPKLYRCCLMVCWIDKTRAGVSSGGCPALGDGGGGGSRGGTPKGHLLLPCSLNEHVVLPRQWGWQKINVSVGLKRAPFVMLVIYSDLFFINSVSLLKPERIIKE